MSTKNLSPHADDENSDRRDDVTIVDITDPTAASETVEVLTQDVVHLGADAFNAKRITVPLESGMVIYHSTNNHLRAVTKVEEDYVLFASFGPNTRGSIDGIPIGLDVLVCAEQGAEAELTVEPGHESTSFLVRPGFFEHEFRLRGREHEYPCPKGVEALKPQPSLVRAFFEFGKRVAASAAADPSIFHSHRAARISAQNELLELLIAAIQMSTEVRLTRRERTRVNYSEIVKKSENHALEQYGSAPVYVAELCEIVGVSERTLQNAFQEIMGMSPFAYLRRVRLHRVRQVLRAETTRSVTVSKVALDWGFWHFGEFSGAYKDCFGERPSQTLQRSDTG